MRVRIAISFELPPGATRAEAFHYVVDAVRSMKGSLPPDGWDGEGSDGDPMFYLDADTIKGSVITTRNNQRQIIRAE